MAKDVLSIRPLNGILVLPRQVFIHSPWLEVKQLIEIVMQLKQLTGHYIDLHDNSICYLVSLLQRVLNDDFILQRSQNLRCILINYAYSSQLARGIGYLKMSWTHSHLVSDCR